MNTGGVAAASSRAHYIIANDENLTVGARELWADDFGEVQANGWRGYYDNNHLPLSIPSSMLAGNYYLGVTFDNGLHAAMPLKVNAILKPTAEIHASATTIKAGQSVTIGWSSTNATSCSVSPTGWGGLSGNESITVNEQTIYTLNCIGPGGVAKDSVTVEVDESPSDTRLGCGTPFGLSPEQEVITGKTGRDYWAINKKYTRIYDENRNANVFNIWKRLVESVPKGCREEQWGETGGWELAIMDYGSAGENAGAYTGGIVEYGFTDLPDDQVAFILAHEIAHVMLNHYLINYPGWDAVREYYNSNKATTIYNVAHPEISILEDYINRIRYTVRKLGFSRENELMADQFAISYMTKAGFNANEGIKFFGDSTTTSVLYKKFGRYFLDHPANAERLKALQERIEVKQTDGMAAKNVTVSGYNPATVQEEIESINDDLACRANFDTSAYTSDKGSLVKTADSATVYYIAANGKRYSFPNLTTYTSWYSGDAKISIITENELSAYLLAGTMTPKPGSIMVKIQSDDKVYVVDKGGLLRWVPTESVAEQLYGSGWNKYIVDVDPTLFVTFRMGPSL